MRIRTLELQNFRNIRHLHLDEIPALVVLAGPNGSGKSAVFDAIRLFKETIGGYSVQNPGSTMVHQLLQTIGPVIRVGEAAASIKCEVGLSVPERERIALPQFHSGLLQGTVEIVRLPSGPAEQASFTLGSVDGGYLQRLLSHIDPDAVGTGVIDYIPPDRKFSVNPVVSLSFGPGSVEADLQRLVVNASDKFGSLTQDLVMMRLIDSLEAEAGVSSPALYIDGIREIFHHFLPDKEFLDIEISRNFSELPRLLVRSHGAIHDINLLSSGEREILMTYAHLEKLRLTDSIVLFDEPELHLHPTLERRVIAHLLRLIARADNQIWLVTHSEEIIGATDYEHLFAMTGAPDRAVVPVRDRAARLELLQGLGADIGLQLVSPRILFLEGTTDAEILPLFFDSIPAGVSLVSTGGKGTLMRLNEAAMRLLEDALVDGQVFFVRDRDIEDDSTVLDSLARQYKGHFFTWDSYHIENYLLDPAAISSVVKDDPDIHLTWSPNHVEDVLRRIADDQKDTVLARRLEGFYDHNTRQRLTLNVREGVEESLLKATESRRMKADALFNQLAVQDMFRQQRVELDTAWSDSWKQLCIGRDVLFALHRQYLTKFYGYEVFRNKVARKIRDQGTVPSKVIEVMTLVCIDLQNANSVVN